MKRGQLKKEMQEKVKFQVHFKTRKILNFVLQITKRERAHRTRNLTDYRERKRERETDFVMVSCFFIRLPLEFLPVSGPLTW